MLTPVDVSELEKEARQIAILQRRWMVGAADALPIDQYPASWQPLLTGADAERALLVSLALASQQSAFLESLTQPAGLTEFTELPSLPLPTLPDSLRGAFRRALSGFTGGEYGVDVRYLLAMLERRGVVAHPADWMPTGMQTNFPEIYLPWSSWQQSKATLSRSQDVSLTEENWDDFYPAERLFLLRQMRLREPDLARELISVCAARESADKRLKIIDVLSIRLSEADVEFLQGLQGDRSKKIAGLAGSFLARLGQPTSVLQNPSNTEAAATLAGWLSISAAGAVESVKLKSGKQRSQRAELLELLPLTMVAAELKLPLDALVVGWSFTANSAADNSAFVQNASQTLNDDLIARLLASLLQQDVPGTHLLMWSLPLLERLDVSHNTQAAQRLLLQASAEFDFFQCLRMAQGELPDLDLVTLQSTYAWQILSDQLRIDLSEGGYVNNSFSEKQLVSLGVLATRELAEALLAPLQELGMLLADPALETLRLNSQLSTCELRTS